MNGFRMFHEAMWPVRGRKLKVTIFSKKKSNKAKKNLLCQNFFLEKKVCTFFFKKKLN